MTGRSRVVLCRLPGMAGLRRVNSSDLVALGGRRRNRGVWGTVVAVGRGVMDSSVVGHRRGMLGAPWPGCRVAGRGGGGACARPPARSIPRRRPQADRGPADSGGAIAAAPSKTVAGGGAYRQHGCIRASHRADSRQGRGWGCRAGGRAEHNGLIQAPGHGDRWAAALWLRHLCAGGARRADGMSYPRLLAKSSLRPDAPEPRETLAGHLADVTRVAVFLANRWGARHLDSLGLDGDAYGPMLRRALPRAALLHDLGKGTSTSNGWCVRPLPLRRGRSARATQCVAHAAVRGADGVAVRRL